MSSLRSGNWPDTFPYLPQNVTAAVLLQQVSLTESWLKDKIKASGRLVVSKSRSRARTAEIVRRKASKVSAEG